MNDDDLNFRDLLVEAPTPPGGAAAARHTAKARKQRRQAAMSGVAVLFIALIGVGVVRSQQADVNVKSVNDERTTTTTTTTLPDPYAAYIGKEFNNFVNGTEVVDRKCVFVGEFDPEASCPEAVFLVTDAKGTMAWYVEALQQGDIETFKGFRWRVLDVVGAGEDLITDEGFLSSDVFSKKSDSYRSDAVGYCSGAGSEDDPELEMLATWKVDPDEKAIVALDERLYYCVLSDYGDEGESEDINAEELKGEALYVAIENGATYDGVVVGGGSQVAGGWHISYYVNRRDDQLAFLLATDDHQVLDVRIVSVSPDNITTTFNRGPNGGYKPGRVRVVENGTNQVLLDVNADTVTGKFVDVP